MVERIDEIEKYYKSVENNEILIKVFLFITSCLSFSPFFYNFINFDKKILTILFIISTSIYFIASQYQRYILIPKAERMRRKQLLSNAFNISLIPEITQNYYNNNSEPSIKRLAINVLENSLFSKTIAEKMLIRTRAISIIFIFFWLSMIIYESSNFDFVMTISQLVFSGTVVISWLNLEVLYHRYFNVYSKLYEYFLSNNLNTLTETAFILDALIEYESAKASAGIKLNSKIFEKINPSISKEWIRIKNTLNI
ncbi:hypothetical protein L5F64_01155 [Aliarcobacter butzleri]|nr:hypothetical protein [Aliarcobacter butzleri]